jgi:flavin-dependent dehydrogenase
VTWDAAVVGGGPAGAAAAVVLARAGRRVLLLDAAGGPRRKVGESLPGGARPLLSRLGALAAVEAGPHRRSAGVWSAWGAEIPVESHQPLRSPHGPGWNLDRLRFDRDLRGLAAAAGATVEAARVRGVERLAPPGEPPQWRLVRTGGTAATARWLIDATGRAASVARAQGAIRQRDDDLVAVAAWFRAADDDPRTLIEAVPDGWWYTARLPGDERVAVLHVGKEDASPLLRRPGAWAERLGATRWISELAGGGAAVPARSLVEGPRGAEAGGARLDRFAGEGWLAVGDAALSFDPLSSQGLLDALYTGVLAGEAVDAALGGDPGPPAHYAGRLERVRSAYLGHHRRAYRDERRWSDRDFWRRRQEG